MFFGAKEGYVDLGQTKMRYVTFGLGEEPLVILPGLGDGLRTVKGMRLILTRMFKDYAKKYKVFIFSRKDDLEQDYSIKEMAIDQAKAMKRLGIEKAHVLGVSMGGMIAQHLAVIHPDLVRSLVLAVTISKPNETLISVVQRWIGLAEQGNYRGLMIDTSERSYSEEKLKKYRALYPIITRIGKPKSFDRFIIQANACINHNIHDELHKITIPTLIIGGARDKIVEGKASEEIASAIEGSKLIVYPDLGHSTYEEAKDFNRHVLEFLEHISE